MERVKAEGDVTQNNEIHQDGGGETVIRDPNNQNGWVDFCERIANLPVSETKLVGTMVGGGGLGTIAALGWLLSPWNGLWGQIPTTQPPFALLIGSGFLLGLGIAYVQTDEESECPICGARFAYRTSKVLKTGRTEVDSGTDVIHGKREKECNKCGHSDVEPDDWTPAEFRKLTS